ncbi:MAG: FMN-binding protein [Hungatella sp.]|nr:FMN-binding protein [Hungatella sp.]
MMKAGKGSQTAAAVCMAVLGLAAAYGATPLYNGMKNAGKGTAVDISGKNAEAYQVDSVWQQPGGGYLVHASSEGFQSTIQVEVLFDGTGDQIQKVSVLSQGDTEGIGSKITEEGFAAGFAGVKAPVQVGDMDAASPVSAVVTGGMVPAGPEGSATLPEWDASDKSAEAAAAKALYDSQMLDSSLEGRPLTMAIADLSAEEQAVVHMTQAGLIEGPAALSAAAETTVTAVTPSPVDGVTGATISSKGAATAVNNAYYFIKEELGQ